MKILFVAATPFELTPLSTYLNANAELKADHFKLHQLEISVLITGPGINQTSYFLTKALCNQQYELVVNVGIAGAFNKNLAIGDVVNIGTERFADLGVEEADGSFTDLHQLELSQPNEFPYTDGKLVNSHASQFNFLPIVDGLTVNKVHGQEKSIEAIRQKYNGDIESMEGAAFFYCCLMEKVAFLQIRSISNYVVKRNRADWNIPLAIERLNATIVQMLEIMVVPAG